MSAVACPRCARLLFPRAGRLPWHAKPPEDRSYPGTQTRLPARELTWCPGSDAEVAS